MKMAWQFTATIVLACIFTSCATPPPGEGYVRQKIPIEIQSGKTVTIEIHHLSGNGPNDVGIRCAPEVWSALTNGTKRITVQLKSSTKKNTEIYAVKPGGDDGLFLRLLSNFHYLFLISGEYRANATVEITFQTRQRKLHTRKSLLAKLQRTLALENTL